VMKDRTFFQFVTNSPIPSKECIFRTPSKERIFGRLGIDFRNNARVISYIMIYTSERLYILGL
jgi:hypothetical protein